MWQCATMPIYLMNHQLITEMITCALILHNMCVSNRVTNGDVNACYFPTNTFISPTDTRVLVVVPWVKMLMTMKIFLSLGLPIYQYK